MIRSKCLPELTDGVESKNAELNRLSRSLTLLSFDVLLDIVDRKVG